VRSAIPIPRAKSTTRGPQRDASESSARTIAWLFTAATLLQPGRDETVAAVCPQHFTSASTINAGLCATTYSFESCG
jgi:hypothetical protein